MRRVGFPTRRTAGDHVSPRPIFALSVLRAPLSSHRPFSTSDPVQRNHPHWASLHRDQRRTIVLARTQSFVCLFARKVPLAASATCDSVGNFRVRTGVPGSETPSAPRMDFVENEPLDDDRANKSFVLLLLFLLLKRYRHSSRQFACSTTTTKNHHHGRRRQLLCFSSVRRRTHRARSTVG